MNPEAIRPAILWIDGVGGFLVCPNDSVELGPAFADPPPDIAILADLSRQHGIIRRDGEGYWLSAHRSAKVNQAPVERALLRDGDRITLGASCQLAFAQPEPLSASGRLTMQSGHRFAVPVDAVILLAETLTMGRSPQSHIVVNELHERAVIFRQGADLAIRSTGTIRMNGQPHRDRAILVAGVPTWIDDVAITLEILGAD